MWKYIWSALLLLIFLPGLVLAQETDTTRQDLDFEQEQDDLNIQQQFDRSMSGGMMTEMGTYQIPNETQYYKRPFKGQEYLDEAVEAYRKEIEDQMGGNWYWQFLRAVSPYINNQFEFGVYQINDWNPVDRNNPLWESYKNDEKKQ